MSHFPEFPQAIIPPQMSQAIQQHYQEQIENALSPETQSAAIENFMQQVRSNQTMEQARATRSGLPNTTSVISDDDALIALVRQKLPSMDTRTKIPVSSQSQPRYPSLAGAPPAKKKKKEPPKLLEGTAAEFPTLEAPQRSEEPVQPPALAAPKRPDASTGKSTALVGRRLPSKL